MVVAMAGTSRSQRDAWRRGTSVLAPCGTCWGSRDTKVRALAVGLRGPHLTGHICKAQHGTEAWLSRVG